MLLQQRTKGSASVEGSGSEKEVRESSIIRKQGEEEEEAGIIDKNTLAVFVSVKQMDIHNLWASRVCGTEGHSWVELPSALILTCFSTFLLPLSCCILEQSKTDGYLRAHRVA